MAEYLDPLGPEDAQPLRELLTRDSAHNLYFLGLLEEFGFRSPEGHGRFALYGLREAGALSAALFVGHGGGLVIPAATADAPLTELCEHLEGRVKLKTCVGERSHVQIATRILGRGELKLSREMRLLRVSADDLGPFTNPTLRLAREDELYKLLPLAAGAVEEVFGRDPRAEDPLGFEARVLQRVRGRRTYVLEEGGELIFKVDVGSRSNHGAELEGLYTVPTRRKQGHATLSLGQVCRHLLSSIPRLVLRVDEESQVARIARKVGFIPGRAQQLVLLD